ncbi:MAG TPA: hypothetical protein VLC46_16360 [Thermoanaerobaculia bacterium]|jgi:hypothetical protein|nr:hypothetical protein [Thermoanaerobaculia bacterium]
MKRIRLSRRVPVLIPVPWLVALFVASAIVCMPHRAIAQTGGAIPIPAASGPDGSKLPWSASLVLRNVTSSPITQQDGLIIFTHEGSNPIPVPLSVTVAPGETLRITDVGANYDPCEPVASAANGQCHPFWIQSVQAGLESSIVLTYGDPDGGPGTTNFDVDGGPVKSMTHLGDSFEFHRVVTDATPATASGAWAVVMNTSGGVVPLVFRVFSSKMVGLVYSFVDELFTAPAGVWLYGIHTARPEGATVQACLGVCNVGAPGTTSPVYVFILTGRDGSVRSPRYPLTPGS